MDDGVHSAADFRPCLAVPAREPQRGHALDALKQAAHVHDVGAVHARAGIDRPCSHAAGGAGVAEIGVPAGLALVACEGHGRNGGSRAQSCGEREVASIHRMLSLSHMLLRRGVEIRRSMEQHEKRPPRRGCQPMECTRDRDISQASSIQCLAASDPLRKPRVHFEEIGVVQQRSPLSRGWRRGWERGRRRGFWKAEGFDHGRAP